ncbi:MFS transporter [Acetobacter fallax]|nr:MFS transporter [Acetobacter fallax]
MTRATPEYRHASLALFLSGFATFSLLYCVQPLLPVFSNAFGITPASSSLSLSVSTVSLAIAILFAAPLSERFGRRELMFVALLASAALNIAAGCAPNWPAMLLLRTLEGITLGGVPAVAMTYLAEEVEPRELAAAMGLYVAGNALGGMIGRVGSGVLTQYFGWRTAMGLVGVIDMTAAVFFVLLLPRSRHFSPRGRLGVSYHISAWARHLFRSALPAVYLIGALIMGAFVTVFNYAGYRLTAAPYHFDQTQQGLLFSVYLFGVGASSVAGILSDRIGRQRVLPVGIATMMAGILLTMMASVPCIVIGISLLTMGFFTSHAIASGWVGRLAKTDRGHATSLYLLCYYMGSSVAGSAGGWFWSAWRWPGIAGFTLIILALAMGSAFWLAGRVRQAA